MTTQETRQPIARESEPLKYVRSLGLGGVRFDGETIRSWIRALVGVDSKLQAGALVADVTCGVGTATLALALAYPRSTFRGFDPHEPSISEARKAAIQSQVTVCATTARAVHRSRIVRGRRVRRKSRRAEVL